MFHSGVEFSRWWLASRVSPTSPPSAMTGSGAASRAPRPPTDAERMRDVLTRLGPAFIKVGQALSSRPDLMPPAYVAALEMLQDRIPPFPDADARAVDAPATTALRARLAAGRPPLPAVKRERGTPERSAT